MFYCPLQCPQVPTDHHIEAHQVAAEPILCQQRSQVELLVPPTPQRSKSCFVAIATDVVEESLISSFLLFSFSQFHLTNLLTHSLCYVSVQKEKLRRERRTGSPATGSPVRQNKYPADVTRRSASPATPKYDINPYTHTNSMLFRTAI